jgi:hypothetical protein
MQTTLTEWFSANRKFPYARELTYIEFPTKWVWNKKYKEWCPRKGPTKIGRAIYINPSCGELYYLRMLLNVAKGATSYEDLRTVSGVLYPTFKDACQAMGLLGDDSEWREALREASMWGSAAQMRQLLVTIVLFCSVCDATSSSMNSMNILLMTYFTTLKRWCSCLPIGFHKIIKELCFA